MEKTVTQGLVVLVQLPGSTQRLPRLTPGHWHGPANVVIWNSMLRLVCVDYRWLAKPGIVPLVWNALWSKVGVKTPHPLLLGGGNKEHSFRWCGIVL